MKLNIKLGTNYVISSSNKKYEASEIECIYMNKNRIGFKLYGKRIVPVNLCFYFQKDQEIVGLKALHEWAERNNKQAKSKFFQTLI